MMVQSLMSKKKASNGPPRPDITVLPRSIGPIYHPNENSVLAGVRIFPVVELTSIAIHCIFSRFSLVTFFTERRSYQFTHWEYSIPKVGGDAQGGVHC